MHSLVQNMSLMGQHSNAFNEQMVPVEETNALVLVTLFWPSFKAGAQ